MWNFTNIELWEHGCIALTAIPALICILFAYIQKHSGDDVLKSGFLDARYWTIGLTALTVLTFILSGLTRTTCPGCSAEFLPFVRVCSECGAVINRNTISGLSIMITGVLIGAIFLIGVYRYTNKIESESEVKN